MHQRIPTSESQTGSSGGYWHDRLGEYWESLDEWKALVAERGIERDLYKLGLCPTPSASPIPRPAKPEGPENIPGQSSAS